MKTSWIETYSGVRVDVFNPQPELLLLRDIAAGLSYTCRFSGQIPVYYSVAQHSMLMADLCPSHAREALMHDAAEAYMGDVAAPIKDRLSDFIRVMARLDRCIAKAYGLVYPWPTEVHLVDRRMVVTEGILLGKNVKSWGIPVEPFSGAEFKFVKREVLSADTRDRVRIRFARMAGRLGLLSPGPVQRS